MDSCEFLFTTQKVKCFGSNDGSAYVPVTLRSPDVPYIALSRITKGDMNFGSPEFPALGLILILVGVALIFVFCIRMKNADTNHSAVEEALGETFQPLPFNAQACPQKESSRELTLPRVPLFNSYRTLASTSRAGETCGKQE